MENFNALGLPERLLQSLKAMQFTKPTPIQSQTIPPALLGSDILGSAQTGTGKTAAYGIPLVAHVLALNTNAALVLTPTRELAIQVLDTLHLLLGKHSEVKTACLIGGDSMTKQLRQLSNKPRIVVGTPGRINDHLERRTLSLAHTNFLVLDETDRMLDMGFSAQLQEIVRYLPQKRQTLMFSATMAPEIVNVANTYLDEPVRIAIGSTNSPIAAITQEVLKTIESDKFGLLLELLERRQGTVIVFVKTKFGTERLAMRLRKEGHNVEAIHGDLRQAKRERVIREFRAGKSRILVATDVAARGIDIPHIECVVNYDLPQCPEDYIHRIGRTGRAGAEGFAVSLVTGQDGGKWRGISRLMSASGTPAEVKIENRVGKPAEYKESEEAKTAHRGIENGSVDVEFKIKERGDREGRRDRKSFGDREKRSFRDRDRKPFGDRPSRSFGDRERKPFGDRHAFGRDREERIVFGGDRPAFGDRDRKSFGGRDRKPFGDRPAFGERDRKPFGERKFFGERDRKPFGDRPAFGGDRQMRAPFGDRPSFGDRDRKPFGGRDRKPFGDRPAFGDRPVFGDRDRKPFGERKSFGDRDRKPFGDRPSFGARKPFGERPGRAPFVDALTEDTPWKRQQRPGAGFSRFGGGKQGGRSNFVPRGQKKREFSESDTNK